MHEVHSRWAPLLSMAMADTLENMAFIEVIPETGETEALPGTDCLGVRLFVHDPVQGEFLLVMPWELINQITQTVLGSDQGEPSEESLFDLLAELLNTVVGRFLSEILPPDQVFRLGVPERCQGSTFAPVKDAVTWIFSAEGMAFSLSAAGQTLLQLSPIETS